MEITRETKKVGENGKMVEVIRAQGRLDSMTAPEFEKQLFKLIDEGKVLIVLDCSKLDYVSSAGLRAFLSTAKKARQATGKLTIGCPSQQVSEILDVAGFSGILPIFKTLEEAVNSCAT
jgi:anti-anti-sigma factor